MDAYELQPRYAREGFPLPVSNEEIGTDRGNDCWERTSKQAHPDRAERGPVATMRGHPSPLRLIPHQPTLQQITTKPPTPRPTYLPRRPAGFTLIVTICTIRSGSKGFLLWLYRKKPSSSRSAGPPFLTQRLWNRLLDCEAGNITGSLPEDAASG